MFKLLTRLDSLPEEVIIENERGFTMLGHTVYSSKMLVPKLDPPRFQLYNKFTKKIISILVNRTNLSKTIENIFPIKLVENLDSNTKNGGAYPFEWYVLVDNDGKLDNDDQGWFYSWNFRNEHWKNKNGIVRRRIWIRLKDNEVEN
ncbi:hypothetical protein TPHA_0C01310 [Tetrapisispora phaffii CBS 4417]|uniref:Peroxin/Ferlin domain-containing protein n=1 Tax=Tetrapisispora phaffii (strain ATCC 24235 / CBS 4417 / NBRC 1672 / NRRL Y-8282 / UCD 70-5) TaxID=1071381 RepID=G8BRB1_TETPH|nr:hypothetical protein TPHA_0C01310 [Tetrapisispora phaffii CBS 4417]CCE62287.1 hypothetical protein TPHA_0C01310 [Tetrapisispora phaffii CBS 4417]